MRRCKKCGLAIEPHVIDGVEWLFDNTGVSPKYCLPFGGEFHEPEDEVPTIVEGDFDKMLNKGFSPEDIIVAATPDSVKVTKVYKEWRELNKNAIHLWCASVDADGNQTFFYKDNEEK